MKTLSNQKIFIVLPNQLFEDISKLKDHRVLLYWHRRFSDGCQKIKFNKLKLAYLMACVLWYIDWLGSCGLQAELVWKLPPLPQKQDVKIYDPLDHLIYKQLESKVTIIDETPYSIIPVSQYKTIYRPGQMKKFSMAQFQRKLMELPQLKRYASLPYTDEQNRVGKIPVNQKIPNALFEWTNTAEQSPYLKKGIEWAESQQFNKNPSGNYQILKCYPHTHDQAKKQLQGFLKERFQYFGQYQDTIHSEHIYLMHSAISFLLNNGLLTKDYVLKQTDKYKNKVHINCFEGYIRQHIGWQPFSQYLYLNIGDRFKQMNHYGLKNSMNSKFYTGDTGIYILDSTIKKAFEYGFLNHIQRLMITLQLFTLLEIKPIDMYKWHYSFALDSQEYVMCCQNCFGMNYADGGMTMQKSYLPSSNYYKKMSNYTFTDEQDELHKALYYSFLHNHYKQLHPSQTRNYGYIKRNQYLLQHYLKIQKKFFQKLFKEN